MRLIKFNRFLAGFSWILVFILIAPYSQAQAISKIVRATDSLHHLVAKASHDSVRLKLLFKIDQLNYLDNAEESKKCNEEIVTIGLKNLTNKHLTDGLKKYYLKSIATAYSNLGLYYSGTANYQVALEYLQKSIAISKQIKNDLSELNAINNVANIYYQQGMYAKAVDHYNKCLHIAAKIKDFDAVVTSNINIGSIHIAQNNPDASIVYFEKALTVLKQYPNKRWETNAIINLGYSYSTKVMYKKAAYYFETGTKMAEQNGFHDAYLGGLNGLGITYNNWADSANRAGNSQLAESLLIKSIGLLDKCIKKAEAMSFSEYIPSALINKGQAYFHWKKYTEATKIANEALNISKKQNNMLPIMQAYSLLYHCYKGLNRYKESLEMHEMYMLYNDSIESETSRNKVMQKEFEYAYTKKALADSMVHAKERIKKNLEIKQQKTEISAKKRTQYFLFVGLALVAVFGVVMYNRYKHTQKQKLIIEQQKIISESQRLIIEEKHKEITDSINYAERIQRSFLATKELLDENLGDYFVYFQPKDVVSGDFYWASKLQNGDFAYVCADSTGHGVPGAIMSIANISCLKESITKGLYKPSDILNDTRELVIAYLKNDGSADGGKDGMDASLIVLNKEKTKLNYAAANNPVLILRNGKIIELQPEKMPIGKHEKDQIPFKQYEFDLQKGDLIYSLTDGMPDQFGGVRGKKYKYAKLKEFLVSVAPLCMADQKEKLALEFNTWKGDLEQVDDVCIIGVRV